MVHVNNTPRHVLRPHEGDVVANIPLPCHIQSKYDFKTSCYLLKQTAKNKFIFKCMEEDLYKKNIYKPE